MPDIQWHMEGEEVSLRDLRNHVSEVLRRGDPNGGMVVIVSGRVRSPQPQWACP